jgi:hypothetical protein
VKFDAKLAVPISMSSIVAMRYRPVTKRRCFGAKHEPRHHSVAEILAAMLQLIGLSCSPPSAEMAVGVCSSGNRIFIGAV